MDKYDLSIYSDDSIFKENISPLRSPTKNIFRTPKRSPLKKTSTPFKNILTPGGLSFTPNDDLLVRETHKLISEVPQDASVDVLKKLLSRIEQLSNENNILKESLETQNNNQGYEQKKELNIMTDKIKNLEVKNEILTKDLEIVNNDYMKNLNELNSLKSKNELLRTKLIKYKNLYEQVKGGEIKPQTKESSNEKDINKLIKMYNEMAGLLNKERKSFRDPIEQTPEIPKQVSQTEILNDLYEKFQALSDRVEHVAMSNPAPTSEINSAPNSASAPAKQPNPITTTTPEVKDVILNCYVCCKDGEKTTSPPTTKRKCARCSGDNEDHRIDLMGEYKWSL
ncbi:hypothetical protein CLIB1444_02S12618 [[Candida] jaroonii]|uniref:Uncharacterized protein n=1 Tax=[Candida] jaroonii TaxID=467808 RepID=A0ACA9Y3R3_9ASCO|nr:hypothetical protein CLIB1444_02S12618 [[Candida] jaroonii]